MHGKVGQAGSWAKGAIAVLGLAALAIPAAAALAGEATLSDDQVEQARNTFLDWSCGACHTLADGAGMGQIGPSLDGDAALTRELIVARLTNGQGAMPAFGGQLSDEEIELMADYILQVKK